jgi:hypothetical protein
MDNLNILASFPEELKSIVIDYMDVYDQLTKMSDINKEYHSIYKSTSCQQEYNVFVIDNNHRLYNATNLKAINTRINRSYLINEKNFGYSRKIPLPVNYSSGIDNGDIVVVAPSINIIRYANNF